MTRRASGRRSWRWRGAADDGSTLPLVIGMLALCLAVVLVGAAATSLLLARMRLLSIADGAALAAAESFDLGAVRRDPDGAVRVVLDDARVHATAAQRVAEAPHPGLDAVELVVAGSPDGRSAVVTVAAVWRPPLAIELVAPLLRVEATSTARVVFE